MGEYQDREQAAMQKCRVCGCTENHACPGGCYWIEPDLCSECVDPETYFDEEGPCVHFTPEQLAVVSRNIDYMREKPENETRADYARSLEQFRNFISALECFGYISTERRVVWENELYEAQRRLENKKKEGKGKWQKEKQKLLTS